MAPLSRDSVQWLGLCYRLYPSSTHFIKLLYLETDGIILSITSTEHSAGIIDKE